MTTDTSERGLSSPICTALTGQPCEEDGVGRVGERTASHGKGWICGGSAEFCPANCLD